jgi:hypothetical protein
MNIESMAWLPEHPNATALSFASTAVEAIMLVLL